MSLSQAGEGVGGSWGSLVTPSVSGWPMVTPLPSLLSPLMSPPRVPTQIMHGGLFSEDGVTLDDIRKIERNRQPPDSGGTGTPTHATPRCPQRGAEL